MANTVQLILLEDVKDLGKIGDQVHVSPGYARNYLLPEKKAEPVTKAALKRIEAKKLKLQQEHDQRVSVAKAMAEKMAKVQLVIKAQSGENDKLFGSVNAAQIIEAAKAEGLELDKDALQLKEPIRELGAFDLDVKLHAEVTGKLKVKVVRMDGTEAAPKEEDAPKAE